MRPRQPTHLDHTHPAIVIHSSTYTDLLFQQYLYSHFEYSSNHPAILIFSFSNTHPIIQQYSTNHPAILIYLFSNTHTIIQQYSTNHPALLIYLFSNTHPIIHSSTNHTHPLIKHLYHQLMQPHSALIFIHLFGIHTYPHILQSFSSTHLEIIHVQAIKIIFIRLAIMLIQ